MELKEAIKNFTEKWKNRDLTVPQNFKYKGCPVDLAAKNVQETLQQLLGNDSRVYFSYWRWGWYSTPFINWKIDKNDVDAGLGPGILLSGSGNTLVLTYGYSAAAVKYTGITEGIYRKNHIKINEEIIAQEFGIDKLSLGPDWKRGDVNLPEEEYPGEQKCYKEDYRQSTLFYKVYKVDNLPDDTAFMTDIKFVSSAAASLIPLDERVEKWQSVLTDIAYEYSPKFKRSYWCWKHKEGDAGPYKEIVDTALEINAAIMQFESKYQIQNNGAMVTQNWEVARKIKEGDIVFLRGDTDIYAYGTVIMPRKAPTVPIMKINDNYGGKVYNSGNSKDVVVFEDMPFYEDFSDGYEQNWGQRVDVEEWQYVLPRDNGIYAKDNEYYGGSSQVAIRPVKQQYGPVLIQKLQAKHRELKMATLTEKYGKTVAEGQALLQGNNSLILTGAPGTGKTYSARCIAALIIGCDMMALDESECFQSVQFHPGYDYADFIVGLKPVLINEEGKNASEAQAKEKVSVSFEWKSGIFKGFAQKALDAYIKAEKDGENPPAYVMLIDEINRADLSRVFGEVFSLLEKDYRYPRRTKGITLPSGEDFILPDNLYIIATMNDIDRSVESMDFALRRRFSWHEVKAVDSERIIDAKDETGTLVITDKAVRDDLKAKMTAINKFIGTWHTKSDTSHATPQPAKELGDKRFKLNLGDEYQIGGSYFLNYAKYAAAQYEALWDNHLKIILAEYLRGNKQKTEILAALKNEYDNATDTTRE